MNPFAPHVTEEVFAELKLGEGLACEQEWPKYDESKCKDDTVEIAVQVNGKLRARITIEADADQETALAAAKAEPKVAEFTEGKNIIKEIYVKGKLVNIVAK